MAEILNQVQDFIVIPIDTIRPLFVEVAFDKDEVKEILRQWKSAKPYPVCEDDFHFYFIKFGSDGNIDLRIFVNQLKPLIGYYCKPRNAIKKYSPKELYEKAGLTFKHDKKNLGSRVS